MVNFGSDSGATDHQEGMAPPFSMDQSPANSSGNMVAREANYRAPYGKQFHTGSSSADSLTPQSLGLWLLHIIDAQEGVLGKLRLGGSITSIPDLDTLYSVSTAYLCRMDEKPRQRFQEDNTHCPCLTTNINGQHISRDFSPVHQSVGLGIKAPLFASVRRIPKPALLMAQSLNSAPDYLCIASGYLAVQDSLTHRRIQNQHYAMECCGSRHRNGITTRRLIAKYVHW